MKRALILSLVAMTVLSACGKAGTRNLFGFRQAYDGVYFRPKVSGDRQNRHMFTVSVKDAGQTLVGAREAARHKANEYCIRQFGSSEITWAVSPDVEDDQLPLINGELVLSGECAGWR